MKYFTVAANAIVEIGLVVLMILFVILLFRYRQGHGIGERIIQFTCITFFNTFRHHFRIGENNAGRYYWHFAWSNWGIRFIIHEPGKRCRKSQRKKCSDTLIAITGN
jgi:hypothetical protein